MLNFGTSHRSLKRSRKKQREKFEEKIKSNSTLFFESLDEAGREAFKNSRMQEKRERGAREREILTHASFLGDPIFVVNCGFTEILTEKEVTSLVTQIQLCANSWKNLCLQEFSCQLHVTSISARLREKLPAAWQEKWHFALHDESLFDLWEDKSRIIFLSPDAKEELQKIETGKIYVIGGIVDRTIQRNLSLGLSENQGVQAFRLPIKKVLNINAVCDILLKMMEHCNQEA